MHKPFDQIDIFNALNVLMHYSYLLAYYQSKDWARLLI